MMITKPTGAALVALALTATVARPALSSPLLGAAPAHALSASRSSLAAVGGRVAFLHGVPTVIRPDIAASIGRNQFGTRQPHGRLGVNPDNFPWPNFVYTCESTNSDCTLWSPTAGVPPFTQGALLAGAPLATPVGTVVNSQGKWWIANEAASNILYYTGANLGAPVPGVPPALNDPGQLPVDVDANLNGNLVAVANIFTTAGGNGSVSVYVNGAVNPTRILKVLNGRSLEGVGVMIDKPGNCFFSFNDLTAGVGRIMEFKKCNGNAIPVPGLPPIGAAGGMAMDGGQHNLYYVDQTAKAVLKCTGEAGPCGLLSTGYTDPVYINFDSSWSHLWVTDVGMNANNGALCYISGPGPIPPAQCFATAAANGDPPVGVAPAPGSLY